MRFCYLNLNPELKTESDCVYRAITLATQDDYEVIDCKLYYTSKLYDCPQLCVCCYKHLLDDYYKFKRIKHCKGMTIEEFANENPYGTFIIRVEGHLTCVIDNTLYDIWDCRNEIVDIIWQVRE